MDHHLLSPLDDEVSRRPSDKLEKVMGAGRIRELLRHAVPAIAVGIASALIFAPALVLPSALFFRDVLHYYWQSHHAVVTAIRAGWLPQWNDGPYMGVPLLGDLHAAVLYPLNLLYLVLSYPRAYAWLIWLHSTGGGLGVLMLIRQLTGRALAGLTAAICFILSGYLVSLHCAGALMAGAAYVPWALVVLNSNLRVRPRLAVLSALLALQAFSGDPQSILFTAIAAIALELCLRPRWNRVLTLAAAFALAGSLSAIQLLPAWQALQESTRGAPKAPFLSAWTTHPLRIAELFLPLPFGGYVEKPQFWAWFTVHGPASTPFALSIYLGASTLLLGLLGVRRQRFAGLGIALFAIGLLLAMGSYVGADLVLERVPPFRFFRYPEKYIFLATLGWSILVGLGAARIQEAEPLPKSRLRAAAVTWGCIAALLASTFLWRASFLDWSRALIERVRAPGDASGPLESAQVSIGTALMVAVLSAAAIYLMRRRPELQIGSILLVAILLVDLAMAARRVVWFEDLALYFHRPEVVGVMERHAPLSRWRFLRHSPALRAVTPQSFTLDQLSATRAWELMTLKSNLGGVFGLEEVSGYGAVELQRTMGIFANIGDDPVRIAQLGAACFILTATGAPVIKDQRVETVQEWPALRVSLLKLSECVPRLHGVVRTLRVEGPSDAALALRSRSFSPTTTAVVEGQPGATFEPMAIENIAVQSQSAAAKVHAPPGGGFLVFATGYYPGWTVKVDGQAAQLVKTNLATMGVRLAEGDHRVQFQFLDPGLGPGAAVSVIGLAIWVLLLVSVRRPRMLR